MSEQPEQQAPLTRPQAFWPTARRLLGEITESRWRAIIAVIMLIGYVLLQSLAPRVIGRAMDLIFAGVIGSRMPEGSNAQQVIDQMRASGHSTTADMLTTVNFVPGQGIDFTALGLVLLLAIGMYAVSALFMWVEGRIINDMVMEMIYRMRRRIAAKLHSLPLEYFDAHQRGDLLSRTTNNVGNVQDSMQQNLSSLLSSVLTIIGVGIMMFTISWQLSLVTLLALPISGVVVASLGKRSQTRFAEQWKATGDLNGHVEEAFTGHDVVRLFGQAEDMRQQFHERNQAVYSAGFAAQFFSGMMMPLMQFVNYLGYVGIAVLGGLKVAAGQISLGDVTAFIQYSRQFNQPLAQMAGVASMLQSGVASAERVYQLLDEPEQDPEHTSSEQAGQQRGLIEFSHVDFSYSPDRPLIQDLNLVARPGQTVAIVGPTGAGKTTLVNLILRFYEIDDGSITLDGTDIREMSRAQLRSATGMVLQDAVLFEGSIMENIRYGRLDATDEEVIEAAKATYVDRFVHALPDGYQTHIDQEGGAISSGERQLITIARAFLASPAVLILDEATSSVDTRTELLVQKAMSALRASRTSFVIAHRLSTIRDADTILVMSDGRIVEQGTHEQLMAHGGRYHELYTSQFSDAPVA